MIPFPKITMTQISKRWVENMIYLMENINKYWACVAGESLVKAAIQRIAYPVLKCNGQARFLSIPFRAFGECSWRVANPKITCTQTLSLPPLPWHSCTGSYQWSIQIWATQTVYSQQRFIYFKVNTTFEMKISPVLIVTTLQDYMM